jgi:glycosyltransferase involved in cell wall biosynthesis
MRTSASRATHVFTVSDYSKREISSRYKVTPKDISVIHNGADRSRFYPGSYGRKDVEDMGLKPGGYILTVGRLEPRKNHLSLINAYAQLDISIPLVIIGQRHFGYQQIEMRIKELGLSGRVKLLENIPDNALASFYRHARIFVYPTWAEGFGMPVVEAMASGVPVITSNTTSLPEMAGEACILISPGDVPALRDAMASLLANDDMMQEFVGKGIGRSEMFSWAHSAEKVKNVYEMVLNG